MRFRVLLAIPLIAAVMAVGASALPNQPALPTLALLSPTNEALPLTLANAPTSIPSFEPSLTVTNVISATPTNIPTETSTFTPIPPSVTPTATLIPTASAKAEAQRVALLRVRFRGIRGVVYYGEIRAYPSADKEYFTVTIDAVIDWQSDAQQIAATLLQRTVETLKFTPSTFSVNLYSSISGYSLQWTGNGWDKTYLDTPSQYVNWMNNATQKAIGKQATAQERAFEATIYAIDSESTAIAATYNAMISVPLTYPTVEPYNPPASSGSGSGATALCNDGTYSYSAHRQGTCSHHGGVAQWYR